MYSNLLSVNELHLCAKRRSVLRDDKDSIYLNYNKIANTDFYRPRERAHARTRKDGFPTTFQRGWNGDFEKFLKKV